ncbi:MAG TPA: hypothetical protein VN651_14865, partial [Gemmatimonadaceae bacterium]|nr:hypothetical protein [Gemmatimonadaceae bacterium]
MNPIVQPNTEEGEEDEGEGELEADSGKFGPRERRCTLRWPPHGPLAPRVHARENLGACEIFRKRISAQKPKVVRMIAYKFSEYLSDETADTSRVTLHVDY